MRRHERGAALLTVALSATALLLCTGLAADAGMLYMERTRMQTAADAAALAGALALPDGQAAVRAQARQLAGENGYAIADADVTLEPSNRVRVQWQRPVSLVLGPLLDRMGMDVAVMARAELVGGGMIYGLRPFALDKDRDDFRVGQEYEVKVGSGEGVRGNFQVLALEGRGAGPYRTCVVEGARGTYRRGDPVETEPGNMVGPTIQAISDLVQQDPTTFAEALRHPSRCARVITVALVDPGGRDCGGGRTEHTIKDFAQFYVTGTGSDGSVIGKFVQCPDDPELPGTSSRYDVRLIQ